MRNRRKRRDWWDMRPELAGFARGALRAMPEKHRVGPKERGVLESARLQFYQWRYRLVEDCKTNADAKNFYQMLSESMHIADKDTSFLDIAEVYENILKIRVTIEPPHGTGPKWLCFQVISLDDSVPFKVVTRGNILPAATPVETEDERRLQEAMKKKMEEME